MASINKGLLIEFIKTFTGPRSYNYFSNNYRQLLNESLCNL